MARALRIQYPGAYYHVTCRGNGKQNIFCGDDDRRKFIALLVDSTRIYEVRLHAYCLMNNHFHLLIQTMKSNCGDFMRRFNVCYTGWFNNRHGRSGHLYQGRYKAFLIDADSYLLEVSRYLHLNVVRTSHFRTAGFGRRWLRVSSFPWSSLRGFIDNKKKRDFVYYDQILSITGGRKYYRQFIIDGLKRGVADPFKDVKYGLLLGSESFVKTIRAECIEEGSRQEQPSYRELVVETLKPEVVLQAVVEFFDIKESNILSYYGDSEVRGMASELLYRYCDVTQSEIGRILGDLSYSGVSKLRFRLKQKMMNDQMVAKKYEKLEAKIRDLSIVKI